MKFKVNVILYNMNKEELLVNADDKKSANVKIYGVDEIMKVEKITKVTEKEAKQLIEKGYKEL